MQFLLVSGFSYQLPIMICTITQFKIVKPMFWRNNLRYVIIIIVIFAAAPMLLLYLLGMMFTKQLIIMFSVIA